MEQLSWPGHPLSKHGVVLSPGPNDAWDAAMVESPTIWFDVPSRRFAMAYVGYAIASPDLRGYDRATHPRVGLAWSDDLYSWTKDPRNPIFSSESHGASGPFVFHGDDQYHLFYFATATRGYESGFKTLNHATSPDLLTWTPNPNNPIIAPQGNGWRASAIWHPNVVHRSSPKHGDRFWLFFNASGFVDGFDEETIGVAESPDLSSWTVRDDINPVLVGSRKPGAWDSTGRAGDPSVFFVDGRWFMAWYSWNGVNTRDGLAWTSDEDFPGGWRNFEGNPILDIGPADSYDALHAGKPFIYRTRERHFHFYTAVAADETRQIALATAAL